jgi:hypothetical protein
LKLDLLNDCVDEESCFLTPAGYFPMVNLTGRYNCFLAKKTAVVVLAVLAVDIVALVALADVAVDIAAAVAALVVLVADTGL